MLMPIRDVEDITGAQRYLRSQLADGTTLAHLVLNRCDLSRGKFRISMPEHVNQLPLFDFGSRSAVLHLDGDEQILVARVVKSFLKDTHCGVLMQETQVRTSDRFFKGKENLVCIYQDELYWPIGPTNGDLSDAQMLRMLNMSSTYPFSAFFYVNRLSSPRKLVVADLEKVLAGIVGVAVDALDADSYLLWWRDDLRAFPSID